MMARKTAHEPDSEPPDDELLRRIDRLRSGIEQAQVDAAKLPPAERTTAEAALARLNQWLDDALKPGSEKRDRIGLVQRTEAELCRYESKDTLSATHTRLKTRLYKLDGASKAAWLVQLARFEKVEKRKPEDEQEYRQLLSRLTYEQAEASESFNRLAERRTGALSTLLVWAFVCVVSLIGLFVFEMLEVLDTVGSQHTPVTFLHNCPRPFLIMVLLAGSLGAAVTGIRSLIIEEKQLPEYSVTVLLNLLIRLAFGAVYAIVVVLALVGNILPLRPNSDEGLLMFLVVAAVAAGISDKLFGKAISAVIRGEPKEEPEKKAK